MSSFLQPNNSWQWPNFCTVESSDLGINGSAAADQNTISSTPGGGGGGAGPAATKSFASEFDDIGNAFKNLSMEEREVIFNELHGCTDESTTKESPQMISQKLAQLDAELKKKTGTATSRFHDGNPLSSLLEAYTEAYQQDKEYVEDTKFRLMFLRADSYDVKAAAQRMLSFFEQKLNLFGFDKLTKRITYDDLSEDDLESLHCGCVQSLPFKDSAGRTVLISFGPLRREKTIQNYVSVFAYGMDVLVDPLASFCGKSYSTSSRRPVDFFIRLTAATLKPPRRTVTSSFLLLHEAFGNE